MRYKCSSTVAVAKLSTAYLEEAKRNHHMPTCDAHTSYLQLCARRLVRSLLDLKRTKSKVSDKS